MGVQYKLLGLLALPVKELDQLEFKRRVVAGRELLIARTGEQEALVGERFTTTPFVPGSAVTKWLGAYKPLLRLDGEEPVASITLGIDNEVLLARVRMTDTEGGATQVLPVRWVSDNEVRVIGPLADFGEVVQRRDFNGRPGFVSSGISFVHSD